MASSHPVLAHLPLFACFVFHRSTKTNPLISFTTPPSKKHLLTTLFHVDFTSSICHIEPNLRHQLQFSHCIFLLVCPLCLHHKSMLSYSHDLSLHYYHLWTPYNPRPQHLTLWSPCVVLTPNYYPHWTCFSPSSPLALQNLPFPRPATDTYREIIF